MLEGTISMLERLRHKLRYWLSKEYRRETHAIGEIKKTFAGLPRCQATVVVANPDYGEGEYQATITMQAKDLLAWVNARLESGSPLYTDKVLLPLLRNWLKDAQESGSEQSRFPAIAYEVIEREINDWIESGLATVYCPSCASEIQDFDKAEKDRWNAGNSLYFWTDNWVCPAGHLLYRRNEWMHINRLRHRVDTRNW